MNEALGPELAAPTASHASDSTTGGEMAAAFEQVDDVHKLRHYLPVYESNLPRTHPIRMLEIGVSRGGSFKLWRRVLHPGSVIVGIDINPKTKQFDDPAAQTHVRIGGQQDTEFLRSVIDEFGPFDVILDDGSHMASHMVESFRYLFLHGLVPGGAYIVEDIHTNYWTRYRDQPLSFVDFTKQLVDAMHAHYMTLDSEPKFREGHPKRVRKVQVPRAAVILEKVEFYDSIAAFHRAAGDKALPRSVRR